VSPPSSFLSIGLKNVIAAVPTLAAPPQALTPDPLARSPAATVADPCRSVRICVPSHWQEMPVDS
jgi:hypothetical protein